MNRKSDAAKQHGLHYTPPEFADFLAARASKYCNSTRALRVLDPACGDGQLLIAARAALMKSGVSAIELHGADRDEGALAVAASRLGPGSSYHRIDLTEEPGQLTGLGKFDLVITNPPYVRTQVLGSTTSSRLAREYSLTGRVDLAHAFCAITPQLLSDGGVFALLCSNRFMSTKAGANIRRLLAENFEVDEVYDLGDTKLFEAAVLPAVVVARLSKSTSAVNGREAHFASAYETTGGSGEGNLFAALARESAADTHISFKGRSFEVRSGALRLDGDYSRPWKIESEESSAWLSAIEERTWKKFGEVAKIRVGIKTTADSVFIRDDWGSLPEPLQPEEKVLLPLLTHKNLTAWRSPTSPTTRVLYPYDLDSSKRALLPMQDFPRAMTYLRDNYDRLSGRKYVIEAGREWYEIWVAQRPARWKYPKIVFPDISEEARFAIDDTGAVVNGDCYWIDGAELPGSDIMHLMVGVANSDLVTKFYDLTCGNKLYAGRRRWITQYVGAFPLPDPTASASKEIVRLSRELCSGSPQADTPTLLNEAVSRALLGA